MKLILRRLCWSSAIVSLTVHAGILRHDIAVQDYRDFGENLGKYRVGHTHIPIYRKDNTLGGYLEFPMPDLGMVNTAGYATLISPSYIVSVKHNGGYNTTTFGNGAKYATTYKLINRNDDPVADFHVPRLHKVVTDAAPVSFIGYSEISKITDMSRFPWAARVGAGTQGQISDDQTELIPLASAYQWKTGGSIATAGIKINSMLRWSNWTPDSPFNSPLSIGTQGGDSGSPIFFYDALDNQWKLVGVHATATSSTLYDRKFSAALIKNSLVSSVLAENIDPDITDTQQNGDIHWGNGAITQGSSQWQWHGLASNYASLAPSQASNEELDATKDLRFNGAGGTIILDQAVNMGAAKLRFSADYLLRSAEGADATWAGGGIEVDTDNTVLWQVNGVKDDALHKIGAGTLHINAVGTNKGSLNVGDGTVILDQQADENGNRQAFSSVTLVSGRATVVLNSADQVSSDKIQFGYRGGTLDLNGNALSFSEIKHNDNGARIVNHNGSHAALLTLTGSNQTFLGELGEAGSDGQLNLHYQPQSDSATLALAGGASLNELAINKGTLQLSGQQVLHANKVYYSNDWDEKSYAVRTLEVAPGAALTLGEHGQLTAATTLNGNARLNVYAKTILDGSVELADSAAELRADISQRTSTLNELTSRIDADISGAGSVSKYGEGLLTLNGDVSASGGVRLAQGELEINSRVTSNVHMADHTRLSGSGRMTELVMGDGAALLPGSSYADGKDWSALRIAQLTTGAQNSLVLDSAFSAAATDRLLIDGDLDAPAGEPVLVTVNAKAAWASSDNNGDGIANNREGVSVIQIGGKASADSFSLADGYVARGAWAYGLYAFAPGKASADERLVEGAGNQFWDYRLQNIMLEEDDNTTPTQPEEEKTADKENDAEEQPEVITHPQPNPQPQPEPQPQPDSKPAARPAVIPQVPAYISMPTAFLRFAENMQGLMATSVGESSSGFFLSGFKGGDRYHAANDFSNYGYNFDNSYHGWLIGSSWQFIDRPQHSATFSLGLAKGQLQLTPRARDGVSNGQFSTLSINSQLSWQNDSGFRLALPFGYHRFHGRITTPLRGLAALPSANSWHIGMEVGNTWTFGQHYITPLAGLLYQHLDMKPFTDSDRAIVSWKMHHMPQFFAGAKYDYLYDFSQHSQLRLGADLRVIHRPTRANETLISDGLQQARFASGQGGDSLQASALIGFRLLEHIELTSELQHQRRLGKEGVDDWRVAGGIKGTF